MRTKHVRARSAVRMPATIRTFQSTAGPRRRRTHRPRFLPYEWVTWRGGALAYVPMLAPCARRRSRPAGHSPPASKVAYMPRAIWRLAELPSRPGIGAHARESLRRTCRQRRPQPPLLRARSIVRSFFHLGRGLLRSATDDAGKPAARAEQQQPNAALFESG